MTRVNEVTCPVCETRTILLVEKPGEPSRLIGKCDCGSGRFRNVIETDDPNYVPFEDRLEPGEPAAPKPSWQRSKRK